MFDFIRDHFRKPTLEETLIGEEGILVDAEINGRRLTYAHERSPERGVLTAYKAGNRDAIEMIFYDTHIPPSKKRKETDRRRQVSQGTSWSRALEQIDVHHDNGIELFTSPKGGTFEYGDKIGNTYRATSHDPVAQAVINKARERYSGLQQIYAQLLRDVQQEAAKIVSR
jgi:hypothetical protein